MLKLSTIPSQCALWFTVDNRCLLQETLFGVAYIPTEGTVYSSIEMFNEIEDARINVTSKNNYQVCLTGDFNSHTGTCDDFVYFDNNIISSQNMSEEDGHLFNNIHVLNELNVPLKRSYQDQIKNNNYGNRPLELCRNLAGLVKTSQWARLPVQTLLFISPLPVILRGY